MSKTKTTWKEKKELIDDFRREIDTLQNMYIEKLEENERLKAEIRELKGE